MNGFRALQAPARHAAARQDASDLRHRAQRLSRAAPSPASAAATTSSASRFPTSNWRSRASSTSCAAPSARAVRRARPGRFAATVEALIPWRFPPIHDRADPAADRSGASRRVAFALHPRHAAGGAFRPDHAAGDGVVRRADSFVSLVDEDRVWYKSKQGLRDQWKCPDTSPFARTPSSIPTRRSWSTTPPATSVSTTTRW